MTPLLIIPNTLIFMSMISFLISRKKTLMSLMSLEFILLNMFMCFIMTMSFFNSYISLSIFMLVLGACEASLGLSLLINMSRYKGNDMLLKHQLKF